MSTLSNNQLEITAKISTSMRASKNKKQMNMTKDVKALNNGNY